MLSRQSTAFICVSMIMASAAMVSAQTIVNNPDHTSDGVQVIAAAEQWRVGGEDEDFFFGTIGRIHQDQAGKIYILDGQLCQVHVLSSDGELLNSLGGEGDGPGEFRGPNDFFVSADGTINVLMGFPGKIVKISADGTPAGITKFSVNGTPPAFGLLLRGLETEKGLYLGGIQMEFGASGESKQTYFLSSCNDDGNEESRLAEKLHIINYANFRLEEGEMDFVWNRMDAGANGLLYMAEHRNKYSISVMEPDGTVKLIINRDFKAQPRTDRQKKNAEQLIDGIAGYHPAPLKSKAIEEFEPAIGGFSVINDGSIWVQPNIRKQDLPTGTWTSFDVFNADGKLEKQVAIEGSYNRNRDSAYLLPDGRLIVVTSALDAFLNQMGATGDEEPVQEAALLEVICYKLND